MMIKNIMYTAIKQTSTEKDWPAIIANKVFQLKYPSIAFWIEKHCNVILNLSHHLHLQQCEK